MHHGTPVRVIRDAPTHGVDPGDIMGVRGCPNRVPVPHGDHMDAHNGGFNGGMPRYNDTFFERLEQIRRERPLTAADYWAIRAQLLWEYFGIYSSTHLRY